MHKNTLALPQLKKKKSSEGYSGIFSKIITLNTFLFISPLQEFTYTQQIHTWSISNISCAKRWVKSRVTIHLRLISLQLYQSFTIWHKNVFIWWLFSVMHNNMPTCLHLHLLCLPNIFITILLIFTDNINIKPRAFSTTLNGMMSLAMLLTKVYSKRIYML